MTTAPQKNTPKIRIGGLMRCCILTIEEDAPKNPKEGDKMRCRYCKSGDIIFKDGAWEWDR